MLSDDGTLGVAGVPSKAVTWAEIATKASDDGHPARGRARLRAVGRVVPVRCARVGRRGRHARPAGSSRSATSRSTTAAASSTRCWSTARCTAGSRRASRRRCGRRWSTTTTATRSRRRSPSTPSRARRSSRRSRSRTPRRRRRSTRSAPRASASRPRSGSTPAVQNAVVDALSHLGVRHVDMPCTPERVWRADRGRPGRHARPTRGASRPPRSPRSRARRKHRDSPPRDRRDRPLDHPSRNMRQRARIFALSTPVREVCRAKVGRYDLGPMKIAVCVKHVPCGTLRMRPDASALDRTGPGELNATDKNAIEEALRLKEGGDSEVVLVTMGPAAATESLRTGLGMGADRAVLVDDDAVAGSDLVATSRVLASGARTRSGRPRAVRPADLRRRRRRPLGRGGGAARGAVRVAGEQAHPRHRHLVVSSARPKWATTPSRRRCPQWSR